MGGGVFPWFLSGTRKVPLDQDMLGEGIRPKVGAAELPVPRGLMSVSGAEALSREHCSLLANCHFSQVPLSASLRAS